jgi:UPF0755 protein
MSERSDAEREAARQAREAKRRGLPAPQPPPVERPAARQPPAGPPASPRISSIGAPAAPPKLAVTGTPVLAPTGSKPPKPSTAEKPTKPPKQSRPPKPPKAPKPPKQAKALKPSTPAEPPRPLRPRSRGRRLAWAVLGLMVLIIVVAAWFLISLLQPFAGTEGKAIEVTVPPRSSTSQIGSLLAKDKVVSSSLFFRLRAELAGNHFTAGTYALAKGMSYSAALSALKRGPQGPVTTNVTIIPGKSRYQLTQLLKSQGETGNYSQSTLKSPLLNPTHYGAPKHTPTLEGFLYPDTYQLRKPISISALVADQLKQFKLEMAKVNLSFAKSKNLTAYDVLTIASLEDAEAALPSDLPKVASVIYNRLAAGMDLGLDTTAAYATHNYTGNLTAAQLKSSSPWNTLNHPGLPPTPIDSPDLAAINAAAHPAKTNDLYFIVKVCGNGALSFTHSYSHFLALSRQYSQSLAAKGATKTEFCHSSSSGGSSGG